MILVTKATPIHNIVGKCHITGISRISGMEWWNVHVTLEWNTRMTQMINI